jgi:hypothetical protein
MKLMLPLLLALTPLPEKPPALTALTPAARERIDRAAMQQPAEKTGEISVDLAGDLTVWLMQHLSLSAEEELQAAALVHQRILDEHKGRIRPTPAALQKSFDKLLSALPDHLKPDIFSYSLTILDSPRPAIFTSGAGHVYLTTKVLDALAPDTERGRAVLTYLLARELGHIGLGHARRGYQLQTMRAELQQEPILKMTPGRLAEVLRTSIAAAGQLVPFLYAREQQHDADMFAFHLCRNAGVDLDAALDALRWLVAGQYPTLLTSGDLKLDAPPALLIYSLSSQPDALKRLKRLLLERAGQVEDSERFGLFLHDRATGKLKRCPDQVAGTDRGCIIFVHGMHGDGDSFTAFRSYLDRRPEAKDVPILVFLFPANGSLTCGGEMLTREVARTVRKPERASFICHSAGGLVFRYYAEKKRGAFHRAVLMGTPNAGSEMTPLKFLTDLFAFGGNLFDGLPAAIRATASDGRGHLTPDLKPDSLFLRYLGRDDKVVRRYQVIYGKFLSGKRSAAVYWSFVAARMGARQLIRDRVPSPTTRRLALRLIDGLRLTDEVLDGDLIVSVDSARLEGAGQMMATRLSHQELKTDKDVMREVAGYLFGADAE